MSNFQIQSRWLPAPVIASPRKTTPTGSAHVFFSEILKNGREVGAVAPTSRRLARSVVEAAGVGRATHIIELGAGTGAVTAEIVRSKSPVSRLLALERHSRFAAILRARFPDVAIACDCVSKLPEQTARMGMAPPDCIVSSLPWTSFPERSQRELLLMIARLLRPDGIFATIACYGIHRTASGRRFQTALGNLFGDVRKTGATWRNFPPAFVYRCARPRPA